MINKPFPTTLVVRTPFISFKQGNLFEAVQLSPTAAVELLEAHSCLAGPIGRKIVPKARTWARLFFLDFRGAFTVMWLFNECQIDIVNFTRHYELTFAMHATSCHAHELLVTITVLGACRCANSKPYNHVLHPWSFLKSRRKLGVVERCSFELPNLSICGMIETKSGEFVLATSINCINLDKTTHTSVSFPTGSVVMSFFHS